MVGYILNFILRYFYKPSKQCTQFLFYLLWFFVCLWYVEMFLLSCVCQFTSLSEPVWKKEVLWHCLQRSAELCIMFFFHKTQQSSQRLFFFFYYYNARCCSFKHCPLPTTYVSWTLIYLFIYEGLLEPIQTVTWQKVGYIYKSPVDHIVPFEQLTTKLACNDDRNSGVQGQKRLSLSFRRCQVKERKIKNLNWKK